MGFETVVGHDRQKKQLLSYIDNERLPHAFLFSGQEGVGKKRVAMEFSKYLLCNTGDSCGICRSCIKIEKNTHPDVLVVEGVNSIGIDQSRKLGREIYQYPYESDRRIILIDRAEIATGEAMNALLKTLEEPPTFNVFILVTSSEKDIPPTIRSRCARIGFGPLSKEELRRFFLDVPEIGAARAEMLSDISYGSIGCGFFWASQENMLLRQRIAELVTGKDRNNLIITAVSERISADAREMNMFLYYLLSLFRDMYVFKVFRDASLLVNQDVRDILELEDTAVRIPWIMSSLKRIQEAIYVMRYNINKWLLFENLMIHLARSE